MSYNNFTLENIAHFHIGDKEKMKSKYCQQVAWRGCSARSAALVHFSSSPPGYGKSKLVQARPSARLFRFAEAPRTYEKCTRR